MKDWEENTVEWKQDGEDKYIVTYIFNKVDNIEEQELNAKIELNLYDSKKTKITAENSIELDQEEKNSIISTEILNAEDEIYKGKLYEEKQREITENVKINVHDMGIDMLSLSGHKFYGPKGIGALYVRDGINFRKYLNGGHQERDKRAGTENIAGIVGLAKAIELADKNLEKYNNKLI